jgi:hypothetical protein
MTVRVDVGVGVDVTESQQGTRSFTIVALTVNFV